MIKVQAEQLESQRRQHLAEEQRANASTPRGAGTPGKGAFEESAETKGAALHASA